MAIERIDQDLCVGCGLCVEKCSRDVIRFNRGTKKAFVMYPDDCICCGFCAPECPKNAITIKMERAPLIPSW